MQAAVSPHVVVGYRHGVCVVCVWRNTPSWSLCVWYLTTFLCGLAWSRIFTAGQYLSVLAVTIMWACTVVFADRSVLRASRLLVALAVALASGLACGSGL